MKELTESENIGESEYVSPTITECEYTPIDVSRIRVVETNELYYPHGICLKWEFKLKDDECLQKCEEKQVYERDASKKRKMTYRNKGQFCKNCIGEEKPAYGLGLCRDCYREDYRRRTYENGKFCVRCIEKGEKQPVQALGLCMNCYASINYERSHTYKNKDKICKLCIQKGIEKATYGLGLCRTCYRKDYDRRKIENNEFCVQCIEKGKEKAVHARGLCRACVAKGTKERKLANILNLADDQLCFKCIQNDDKQLVYARGLCGTCYASKRNEEKREKRRTYKH